MGILQDFEKAQLETLKAAKNIPEFIPGDTLKVNVIISEGSGDKVTQRVQAFMGLCIARKTRGLRSAFTVRKISNGEGVQRTFPLYSPRIESIEVMKRGRVRRAKLYYIKNLTGKKARIKERMDYYTKASKPTQTEA